MQQNNIPPIQRTIVQQMKANCDLQAQILKDMQHYREAVEHLAERNDKLAQSISKFALASAEGFNNSKQHSPGTVIEHQQRQLFAALQQIVRFNTHISSELLAVANTLQSEFDRPIRLNLEKYRSVVHNWERDFDREVKRIETDIRHKESDAAKAGKEPSGDMSKLSQSLQQISGMVAELQRVKQHRVEQAFYTDHKQFLFVAHHLQKVLKAEIQCHKAIYYHDRVKKNPAQQQQDSSADTVNHITPARDGTEEYRAKQTLARPTIATAGTFVDSSADALPSSSYAEYQQQHNDEIMPAVPRNAHRKTQLITESPFLKQTQSNKKNDEYLQTEDDEQLTAPPQIPDEFRKSVFVPAFKTMKAMQKASNTTDDKNSEDGFAETSEQQQHEEEESIHLALVLFDYPARAPDDLNVLESDIVRVIAIEGEWMYGLLLQPAGADNDEYVPSEVNGMPQVGWLPVSFTTSIQ